MKKRRFKKWVEYLLIIINFIAFMLLGSDSDSLGTFLLIHFIAINIFIINCLLLSKYGHLKEN